MKTSILKISIDNLARALMELFRAVRPPTEEAKSTKGLAHSEGSSESLESRGNTFHFGVFGSIKLTGINKLNN